MAGKLDRRGTDLFYRESRESSRYREIDPVCRAGPPWNVRSPSGPVVAVITK